MYDPFVFGDSCQGKGMTAGNGQRVIIIGDSIILLFYHLRGALRPRARKGILIYFSI